MTDKRMPIQYRVEIYVDSFNDDPDASFESNMPFPAICVGDTMEPSTWPNAEHSGSKVAKVIAVRHLLWEIENSHIGHSLSVCVTIEDKPK
ncbi:MAG: hypothetical protein BWX54_02382 [Verrucomicrobia bacterium ADurb.Bin018]|nr:MAG: hypothetical protein BWX54_02382 [Verrucomicrobia bacterium ADurb.Bin018]